MNMKLSVSMLLVFAAVVSQSSLAQTKYSEDFTGAATNNSWYYFNGACLTAGTSTGTGTPGGVGGLVAAPGLLPSCTSILDSYYSTYGGDHENALVGGVYGVSGNSSTLPDPANQGALRLTNGYPFGHSESGAIVSQTPFDAGQGVQITFKTVSYRGDSQNGDGADGISFYLLDGSLNPGAGSTWNGVGSWGGSLGYTCSNSNPPYDGAVGAYLGLGIDEYGNFLNGQNLMPGYVGMNNATGDNTALGYGAHPGRFGLRGAGSVSWAYLNKTYPTYYPTSILNTTARQQAAVQTTCKLGSVINFSTSASSTTKVSNPTPVFYDYAPIPGAYSEISGFQIATESAMKRGDALPIVYNLKITQNGLLSFKYTYSTTSGPLPWVNVITNQDIKASNGLLPPTLRFGFAGSTGGATNIHEIMCFQAAPLDNSASSASTDQQQVAKLQTSSQAYFAYYNPNDWTGSVTSYALTPDTITGAPSLSTLASWDAQCNLTGIPTGSTCQNTGTGPIDPLPVPASRVMLTWNNVVAGGAGIPAGIPFEWPGTAGLTLSEQGIIDLGDATATGNRVNYLRGDRTNEINTLGAGLFRTRNGVLGDVIDSSPIWVGSPGSPYAVNWKDRYVTGDTMVENAASQKFAAFKLANQGRLNVVYVGANDGFMHGFRAGSEDVAGKVLLVNASGIATPNDGREILAYMPGAVLKTIHQYASTPPALAAADAALDYSNPLYGHNFYADATPGTGDLFYQGAWHTWLVSGLAAGGAAVFALDITDPVSSTVGFSEANAAQNVIGEWDPSTIICTPACGSNLGNTFGTPIVRRFHDGNWGVIFGNGFSSTSGDAGIYVMTVNQSTGAKKFYYLSTGWASAHPGMANGIAYVTATDFDGDHVSDYAYAGDLQGNVWRFDLTSASEASWVAQGPLFTTPTGQPITTPIVIATAPLTAGAVPAVVVSFGTGQRTRYTNTSPTTFAPGTQSLYGVWDWNFSDWNTHTASQFASLSSAQAAAATAASAPYALNYSNLQQQMYTAVAGVVNASNTPITWAQCTSGGSPSCSGVFGWYVNLPAGNEQIVSSPILNQQAFVVNSVIPAVNDPLSCSLNTDKGTTYLVSVVSGGTFVTPPGSTTSSGFVNNKGDSNMVGLATNETGALTVVHSKNTIYLLGQNITPIPGQAPGTLVPINLPNNTATNRATWIQLR